MASLPDSEGGLFVCGPFAGLHFWHAFRSTYGVPVRALTDERAAIFRSRLREKMAQPMLAETAGACQELAFAVHTAIINPSWRHDEGNPQNGLRSIFWLAEHGKVPAGSLKWAAPAVLSPGLPQRASTSTVLK